MNIKKISVSKEFAVHSDLHKNETDVNYSDTCLADLSGEKYEDMNPSPNEKLTNAKQTAAIENKRIKRANLTEEQRAIRLAEELEKIAWLTEKHRELKKIKRNARVKEQHLQFLASEKDMKKVETARRKNLNESVTHTEDLKNIKLSQNISDDQETMNPLRCLESIELNVDTEVFNLDLLKRILLKLDIKYPQKTSSMTECISYGIYLNFLIKLLENWKEWNNSETLKNFNIQDNRELFMYLYNNFFDVQSYVDECLFNELYSFRSPNDFFIDVSCSLKQLKSMFYHKPNNYERYYQRDSCNDYPSPSYPLSFVLWPYISTEISLPSFSIIRQNCHIDYYNLIEITNISENYSSHADSTRLHFKNTKHSRQIYLTSFIAKFLNQLKIIVNNRNDLTFEKKLEITKAITEFELDVELCSEYIETNTEYHKVLSQYPYGRYLGKPENDVMQMSIEEQKSIDVTDYNVRMHQVRHPKISFNLKHFSVLYEEKYGNVNFICDERFLNGLKVCMIYKCTLCNKCFPLEKISEHLIQYHGIEPDWECVKCLKSMSNDYLILNRWQHECKHEKE